MLSKFKCIKRPLISSLPTLQIPHQIHFQVYHPTKNPNKTLNFIPKSISSSSITSTIASRKMSSWSCSACTFLNPPSQKLTCQICQTPSPSPSSSIISSSSTTVPKWSCKACTFLNSYSRSTCEICDTRAPSSLDHDDCFANPSSPSGVGSIFFPLRKCDTSIRVDDDDDDPHNGNFDLGLKDKVQFQLGIDDFNKNGVHFGGSSDNLRSNKRKFHEHVSDDKMVDVRAGKGFLSLETAENGEVKKVSDTLKILSYNVWFRDEIEGYKRMEAIGDLIQLHSPDVICFQEVNLEIYKMFQRSTWWKRYQCSVTFERAYSEAYFCMQLAKLPVKSFSCKRFSYSIMGRELCIADVKINEHKSVVVATTHLESPNPGPPKWDQMYSKERVNQAKEAISFLSQYPNVIFCGDMNWDDKLDGRFPYTEGWFDVWEKLRPAELGYTYDTKSNKMLTGNSTLQKRLDRFICHLPDFEVSSIDIIGTEAIPGVMYTKEKKTRGKIKELNLPVYPSDHYGLLLTVTCP